MEEFIPIFGILFGIGGPAVVIVVWFTLNYYKRRKLMELHHAERMAAIERGMEIPPLPIELIDGRSVPKRRRTALLPGLVWFFIGLALVVGALADRDSDIPVFLGLIPASRISSITSPKGAQSKRAGSSTISRRSRPPDRPQPDSRSTQRPAVQLCAAGRVFWGPEKQRDGPGMLSIRNLSKSYGNVQALRDVSLEVPPGMFGLLGPNGAGKSSLMRTIATLQDPDGGSITFDGIDVAADKDRIRRTLGYLPQDFGVYPKVSAQDMLDHFAVLKGYVRRKERAEAVESLLQQVNLWDVRKRKLGTFSGGMRQRFGIAQALLGNPRLVIVDEPTAGLDPEERNRFLNLLAGIGEQVVVILSTHIVEDVADLCSRMAIISRGQVLMSGQPREAIGTLRDRVWSKLVSKTSLAEYQQRFNVLSTRLVGSQPLIHVYSEARPEQGFEPVVAGLEDVYFRQLRVHGAAAHA
jgi:ABC-2 type transport system ATP-binding protein